MAALRVSWPWAVVLATASTAVALSVGRLPGLKDAEDARKTVAFWADQGATSFKAYMNITRAELGAAIQEAHKRGLKVPPYVAAAFREAVEIAEARRAA